MRRAFFFIVVIAFATTSLASIPRLSALDPAPPLATPSSETRVWASDVLAPFEHQPPSELTRALHRAYADVSTTNASGLGRFLSVDPVLGDAAVPQSWNRYAYALNNPVSMIDPMGMKPCKITVTGGDAKAHGVPDGTVIDAECFEYDGSTGEGRKSNTSPLPDQPSLFDFFGMDRADRWVQDNVGRPVDTWYAKMGLMVPGGPKTLEECRAAGPLQCQTLSEAVDMFGPMMGGQGKGITKSFSFAVKILRIDKNKASAALHAAKRAAGLGGADNVLFDTKTGNIMLKTGEIIGSLFD